MVVSFILHSKVDVFKLHVFIGGCASVVKTSYLRRRHKSASVVLATLTAMVIVVMLSLPKTIYSKGFTDMLDFMTASPPPGGLDVDDDGFDAP